MQLDAIVAGVTYDLTGGPILWLGDDGTGMAPLRRITERGPLQHGETDLDVRLDPRVIQLKLEALPTSLAGHSDERARLLRIFRPGRTPVQLRWTLDNGAVRQIDGYVSGGMTFGSEGREGFSQQAVVELRCADPTFYDPERKFVSAGIAVSASVFGFPIGFPVSFGEASTIDRTIVIPYTGTWRSYPEIQIVGPLTNAVITNQATGDTLDFTGTTITAGTTYTIDLRYGFKTVTDQLGANQISRLTSASALATWALEADPDVPGGLNPIRVQGSSATSATAVYVRWYDRYIGI